MEPAVPKRGIYEPNLIQKMFNRFTETTVWVCDPVQGGKN